jgi:hypothetical protein
LNTNKSREPLLYIQQPDWNYPESDMQETFFIKKTEAEPVTEKASQLLPIGEDQINVEPKDSMSAVSIKEKEDIEVKVNLENSEQNEHQEAPLNNVISLETEKKVSGEDAQEKVVESTEVQKVIAQYEKERQEEKPDLPLDTRTKQIFTFKRVKSFKEMNTEEKVDYLVNFPKLLPPVPCVFIMSNSSIRGFLVSKIEEEIEIKTFDEKIIHIQTNELNDIKIIGFK